MLLLKEEKVLAKYRSLVLTNFRVFQESSSWLYGGYREVPLKKIDSVILDWGRNLKLIIAGIICILISIIYICFSWGSKEINAAGIKLAEIPTLSFGINTDKLGFWLILFIIGIILFIIGCSKKKKLIINSNRIELHEEIIEQVDVENRHNMNFRLILTIGAILFIAGIIFVTLSYLPEFAILETQRTLLIVIMNIGLVIGVYSLIKLNLLKTEGNDEEKIALEDFICEVRERLYP